LKFEFRIEIEIGSEIQIVNGIEMPNGESDFRIEIEIENCNGKNDDAYIDGHFPGRLTLAGWEPRSEAAIMPLRALTMDHN
jgi:hypothetical protein